MRINAKIAVFLLFSMFTASSLQAMTATQIMQKNRALAKPKTSSASVRLTIKNGSAVVHKQFQIYTKQFGSETRSRINFSAPTRIQFLIYSKPGAASTQWLKTSTGRIRQVAAGDQAASWANSHFFYEDLKTDSLEHYRFERLSDATFTMQDRSKTVLECYRIAAFPKSANAVYSKRILYIDKKELRIRRVIFYRNSRHIKTLSNYRFKTVNGVTAPGFVYMQPANRNDSYSYLWLQNVQFNIPLSSALFRRSSF